jgi:hypothetical protein
MLSEEMVEKFRELYRARFGEDISKEEALAQGTALLNMMKVIYRPLPKGDSTPTQ